VAFPARADIVIYSTDTRSCVAPTRKQKQQHDASVWRTLW